MWLSPKIACVVLPVVLVNLAWASGIKWERDLTSALRAAKRSKKPVMIDFYGES